MMPTDPGADERRVYVELTEQQRQRLNVYVQRTEEARQRATEALTDILVGKDVDLSQFANWGLTNDGRVFLTPQPWPTQEAPAAPPATTPTNGAAKHRPTTRRR